MRIRRVILIPAILALGVAGPVLAGSGISVAAVHAPSAHVLAAANSGVPDVFYHC
jgi:hypothetical protein